MYQFIKYLVSFAVFATLFVAAAFAKNINIRTQEHMLAFDTGQHAIILSPYCGQERSTARVCVSVDFYEEDCSHFITVFQEKCPSTNILKGK